MDQKQTVTIVTELTFCAFALIAISAVRSSILLAVFTNQTHATRVRVTN